ncbi:hypothetical protein TCAL_12829 [Tigriopus californicus]|uniref:SGNH hydrolase-type esterase domain-containing protein n=1 Tax=Tigriopus californicus TaxID=6832 RepID=A0A553NZT6_TIGCA|nr:isoamyl acetate-hydrolyzing esterase 1 homolog [Tigriopus californicus]TRY70956.1 hypothetical protein TCAL_12829 [Tigriopus californicus]|eukprot:TCALIF_12829-PA protein Name:"Similar to Iah1 Isoamyl acetate-hydrolyzing esterase 1 homolog (Rattus norvegicus)" AED:0.01 eAED:0.01 QI:16/1/0.5/1/1/0.5/2/0/227
MCSWPRIVLIGDSLTQFGFSTDGCWASMVANHFQRRCDVINRGFSGYTTNTLRQIFPRAITKDCLSGAKAVTLFIGANDSAIQEVNPIQHVPLNDFQVNLKVLIGNILELGLDKSKLVLIPPPPSDALIWKQACEERNRYTLGGPPKTNEATLLYYKAIQSIAEEKGIAFVDHWKDLLDGSNFNDGLHFSTKGSQTLFQKLLPFLEERTRDVEMQFPDWKDMQAIKF